MMYLVRFYVSLYAFVCVCVHAMEHDVKCTFTLGHGMGQFKKHFLKSSSYKIFWSHSVSSTDFSNQAVKIGCRGS